MNNNDVSIQLEQQESQVAHLNDERNDNVNTC